MLFEEVTSKELLTANPGAAGKARQRNCGIAFRVAFSIKEQSSSMFDSL